MVGNEENAGSFSSLEGIWQHQSSCSMWKEGHFYLLVVVSQFVLLVELKLRVFFFLYCVQTC